MSEHDIVVLVVASITITFLLTSWFYEHELSVQRKHVDALKASHMNRTYDWLNARAEAAVERDACWSFSDQLHKRSPSSMDEHLATLFDEDLMQDRVDASDPRFDFDGSW